MNGNGAASDDRRPITRLLPAVLIALAALVALDSLFRVFLWAGDGPATPAAMRLEMHRLLSPLQEKIPRGPVDAAAAQAAPDAPGAPADSLQQDVLHPYTGFDLRVGLDQVGDELERFARDRGPDDFVLLVTGGSVAGILATRATEAFERALVDGGPLAGRRVRLISHGRGGFKQPQQAAQLAYLLAFGYRPDGVLEIDGFNEVALGLANHRHGAHPLYPSIAHWRKLAEPVLAGGETVERLAAMARLRDEAEARVRDALRRREHWSAILGRRVLEDLRSLRAAYARLHEEFLERDARIAAPGLADPIAGPPFAGGDDEALAAIVDAWVESSASMHALCSARGIVYLHVLQPTLWDPDARLPLPVEQRDGEAPTEWVEGVARGYPLLRAAIPRLAARGVLFHDATQCFRDLDGRAYFDVCHFDGEALDRFAEDVAAALRAALHP